LLLKGVPNKTVSVQSASRFSSNPFNYKWATEHAQHGRVWWCLNISRVTRGPSPPWFSWTQQQRSTSNSSLDHVHLERVSRCTCLDDGVDRCHGVPAEFQPAIPEPWTSTSLGATNYSGVIVQAYCMIDKDQNRWTDGCWPFCGQYLGPIALMLVHRLHSWNIAYKLFGNRRKISDWPKSGQVKTGPTWPSATPLTGG